MSLNSSGIEGGLGSSSGPSSVSRVVVSVPSGFSSPSSESELSSCLYVRSP